jgi:HAMP domain-containing protein
MTIRAKIVGGFLLIALLVPILGGVAISRVQRISDSTRAAEEVALPGVLAAKDLNALQRMQQETVLAYFAGGAEEDRQQYEALKPQIQEKLAELRAALERGSGDDARAAEELLARIDEERVAFDGAAEQLLGAHDAIEHNAETVRVKAEQIVLELTVMRMRFNPNPFAQPNQAGGAVQPTTVQPVTVRAQVWELLFGVEGMMSDVAFEAAIAAGYTVTLNPLLKQRFADASLAFPTFLKSARNAAGPEDRPFLDRVEKVFFQEFEPAARGMIETADAAAASRLAFADASSALGGWLEELAGIQSASLGLAQRDAQNAVQDSRLLLIATTVLAFVLAGALGLWFARRITRPIVELRDVADRISSGDLRATEIAPAANDEVGDLARAFQRMLASIRILMADETPAEETRSHVA